MRPKAVKKTPGHVLTRMANASLAEIISKIDAWSETDQAVLAEQDADTRDAIERMTDIISRIYPKRFWVARSRTSERVTVEIPDELHYKLSVHLAVEAIKDLALMDIKVANFKFPALCAECGVPLKPKKRRR